MIKLTQNKHGTFSKVSIDGKVVDRVQAISLTQTEMETPRLTITFLLLPGIFEIEKETQENS